MTAAYAFEKPAAEAISPRDGSSFSNVDHRMEDRTTFGRKFYYMPVGTSFSLLLCVFIFP
jgi:hypothetical protein